MPAVEYVHDDVLRFESAELYDVVLCVGVLAHVPDTAALLAGKLSDALVNERLVPHFVDSYVIEHGRYGLQVHAGLYRDLLTLLQREALIAVSVTALDLANRGELFPTNKKPVSLKRNRSRSRTR